MKMLIDIPEETYNKIRRGENLYPADANVAIFAIETGIPLGRRIQIKAANEPESPQLKEVSK